MKQFNISRFLNVARWDLTINRKFYTRSALTFIAVICMPVVVKNLSILSLSFDSSQTDDVTGFAVSIGTIIAVLSFLAPSYMFHSLLTKQGRINELTLPATSLEKFVWHAVVTFLCTQIVCFAGVVLADVLHVLLGMIRHITDFESITSAVYFQNVDFGSFIFMSRDLDSPALFAIFSLLMGCSFISTFAMVNAWKYKYNILYTFAMHFCIGISTMMLFGFVVTFVADQVDSVAGIFVWLNGLSATAVGLLLCLFALTLFCGIWAVTFHLYKHAQLTSRRNP